MADSDCWNQSAVPAYSTVIHGFRVFFPCDESASHQYLLELHWTKKMSTSMINQHLSPSTREHRMMKQAKTNHIHDPDQPTQSSSMTSILTMSIYSPGWSTTSRKPESSYTDTAKMNGYLVQLWFTFNDNLLHKFQ